MALHFPRPGKSWCFGCVVGGALTLALQAAVVLAGVYLFGGTLRERAAANYEPPALPDTPADFDWTLRNLETDDALALGDALPGKVGVVTLWSPDCQSCLAELPGLQAMADRIADPDAVFLFIAADEADRAPAAAAAAGVTAPLYASDGPIPETWRPRSVPATYVVARDGTVALAEIGAADWDHPRVERYLRHLLAESPGTAE